jgi:carbamoyl-phosphate synthase large subunit
MAGPLRVLVSSAGRRVELIECFRRAAAALGRPIEVLATDLDPELSAACHSADRYFKVPRCDDPGFAAITADLAVRNGVHLIVPTIDPELPPLAEAAPALAAEGIRVHVADPDTIAVARDKYRTMQVLAAAGVPVPMTADFPSVRADPGRWPWPLFMKPSGGSASRGLAVVRSADELPHSVPEPMILQELLEAPEFTVNCFVDQAGALKTVVTHRRLRIRAGEVEKGRTERNPETAAIAAGIHRALPGLSGVFCFQTLAARDGGARVIEINARFGGGYPLVDRAGATFARWLLEEVAGLPCAAHDDWRDGVLMLRYDAAIYL